MRITKIRCSAWSDLPKRFYIDNDISNWDYSNSPTHHYCAAPIKYRGSIVGWRVFKQFSDHIEITDEMYYFSFETEDVLPALHDQGLKFRDLIALAK